MGNPEIPRIALTVDELAQSAGVGRDKIFEAISSNKMTARKAGHRTTLVEIDEARRWIRSLPWRGKPPEGEAPAAA
jgi:excisionase family DNA binding protein